MSDQKYRQRSLGEALWGEDQDVGRGGANGLGGLFLSFLDWVFGSLDNKLDEESRQKKVKVRARKFNDFRAYELCPNCLKWGFFPIKSVEKHAIVRQCAECNYEWEQN